MLTPAERTLRARIAAYKSWDSTLDRSARTLPARLAMMQKFEREADPNNELLPVERAKRAETLRKLHYARMTYKSSRSRTTKGVLRHRAGEEA